jgi:uncharacterized protein
MSQEFVDAVVSRELERVKELLDLGVAVNYREEDNETALIAASRWGQIEMMKLLLAHGADVKARDFQGHTALHWAAFHHFPDAVSILLNNGANAAAKTMYGHTALDEAMKLFSKDQDKDRVILLLRDALIDKEKK